METELLNEYLFTDLVLKYAHGARTNRIRPLIKSGALEHEAMTWAPIISEDLQAGLAQLERNRLEVLALRRESA